MSFPATKMTKTSELNADPLMLLNGGDGNSQTETKTRLQKTVLRRGNENDSPNIQSVATTRMKGDRKRKVLRKFRESSGGMTIIGLFLIGITIGIMLKLHSEKERNMRTDLNDALDNELDILANLYIDDIDVEERITDNVENLISASKEDDDIAAKLQETAIARGKLDERLTVLEKKLKESMKGKEKKKEIEKIEEDKFEDKLKALIESKGKLKGQVSILEKEWEEKDKEIIQIAKTIKELSNSITEFQAGISKSLAEREAILLEKEKYSKLLAEREKEREEIHLQLMQSAQQNRGLGFESLFTKSPSSRKGSTYSERGLGINNLELKFHEIGPNSRIDSEFVSAVVFTKADEDRIDTDTFLGFYTEGVDADNAFVDELRRNHLKMMSSGYKTKDLSSDLMEDIWMETKDQMFPNKEWEDMAPTVAGLAFRRLGGEIRVAMSSRGTCVAFILDENNLLQDYTDESGEIWENVTGYRKNSFSIKEGDTLIVIATDTPFPPGTNLPGIIEDAIEETNGESRVFGKFLIHHFQKNCNQAHVFLAQTDMSNNVSVDQSPFPELTPYVSSKFPNGEKRKGILKYAPVL